MLSMSRGKNSRDQPTKIMTTQIKASANDKRVAAALGTARVCKASDLAYGSGRYIKRNDGNTSFSKEAYTDCIRFSLGCYPKFVQKFVKENPRVQIVCYSTNTRKLNSILNS